MKLCGLDFETANSCHCSICAVEVALLEDGVVLEHREYLVKPHKSVDDMSKFCRDIHGIFYEDLRHLHNVLSLYNLPSVSFDYICSLQLCRYHFPEAHSHSQNCMADMFGITFQHHDALEDAENCAKIASQLEIPKNFICRFEYLQNV